MARGITPECRYGHGRLVKTAPDIAHPDGEEAKVCYFTPLVLTTKKAQRIDLGRGYSFEIWECLKCSYIELHDFNPLQEA